METEMNSGGIDFPGVAWCVLYIFGFSHLYIDWLIYKYITYLFTLL